VFIIIDLCYSWLHGEAQRHLYCLQSGELKYPDGRAVCVCMCVLGGNLIQVEQWNLVNRINVIYDQVELYLETGHATNTNLIILHYYRSDVRKRILCWRHISRGLIRRTVCDLDA